MESSISRDHNTGTGIVVLGLGNILQGDDGAGVYTIERLESRQDIPDDVELVDGGTLSFTLLDIVENRNALIVIDAMELHTTPGTTQVYIDDELDEFLAAPLQRNVHDLNLGDLLRMCALRGTLPRHRALIGIQPEVLTWQAKPSSGVSDGIDRACTIIDDLIRSWSDGKT